MDIQWFRVTWSEDSALYPGYHLETALRWLRSMGFSRVEVVAV
jgi:hypothetical protein